jgi:transcriptional regulator with XRE-family HTH domain
MAKKLDNPWLADRLKATGLLTLDALADKTGINKGTLSKYFSRKQRPSIEVVQPLCEALQVSPESLLRELGVYQ